MKMDLVKVRVEARMSALRTTLEEMPEKLLEDDELRSGIPIAQVISYTYPYADVATAYRLGRYHAFKTSLALMDRAKKDEEEALNGG